jgi:hypothetical protein
MAERSKAWVSGPSFAEIVDSNPVEDIDVCCVCCELSGVGLCDGSFTRPEESYQVERVWVWSWSLDNNKVWAH